MHEQARPPSNLVLAVAPIVLGAIDVAARTLVRACQACLLGARQFAVTPRTPLHALYLALLVTQPARLHTGQRAALHSLVDPGALVLLHAVDRTGLCTTRSECQSHHGACALHRELSNTHLKLHVRYSPRTTP